jgi:D-glycero-alpha-D-manno-heptose-7-phosphate kinase
MVHFFRPETGFHLVAHSEAPAGAGISGSSALAIALIGALNRLVGNRYDERKFITIAANIETTVIKVPAGFQDYYPRFMVRLHRSSFAPTASNANTCKSTLGNRTALRDLLHR